MEMNLSDSNTSIIQSEEKEVKEETTENTRIYGIDPGNLKDPEEIKSMSELDLYLMIESMGAFIWRCNHDMADNRMEYVDLTEYNYAQEILVYQTTRFGVELAEPEMGKHIEPTESYYAWYKFYSNHFRYTLTDEEWDAFQDARRNGEDVSQYMPAGDWRDSLKKEETQETGTNEEKPVSKALK